MFLLNRHASFSTAPTDLDLLQLTMNRMQKAESDARYLASELKDKVIPDIFKSNFIQSFS
jgi:hypothetical protein